MKANGRTGFLSQVSIGRNSRVSRLTIIVQWVWPVPIFIGTWFAPESPWWLVRQGRFDDAKKALAALTSPTPSLPFDLDANVAMIKATDELEKAMDAGTSYISCFRGIDLRRTEIASMAWVAQAFCGAARKSNYANHLAEADTLQ